MAPPSKITLTEAVSPTPIDAETGSELHEPAPHEHWNETPFEVANVCVTAKVAVSPDEYCFTVEGTVVAVTVIGSPTWKSLEPPSCTNEVAPMASNVTVASPV
jgi:hypothetical protein